MTDNRTPPRVGYYPEATMSINLVMFSGYNGQPTSYSVRFADNIIMNGITAEQAREAAHLLNQLAEYLETC